MAPRTLEELNRIRSSCKKLIRRRALMLGGIALVPIPGLGLLADVSALSDVIPNINRRFGLTPQQIEQLDARGRNTVDEMVRKLGADFVGKSITRRLILAGLQRMGRKILARRSLRFAPMAGQAIVAAWSYSTMMIIGNSHVDACYEIARAVLEGKKAEDNPQNDERDVPGDAALSRGGGTSGTRLPAQPGKAR